MLLALCLLSDAATAPRLAEPRPAFACVVRRLDHDSVLVEADTPLARVVTTNPDGWRGTSWPDLIGLNVVEVNGCWGRRHAVFELTIVAADGRVVRTRVWGTK